MPHAKKPQLPPIIRGENFQKLVEQARGDDRPALVALWRDLGLQYDKKGPENNASNVLKILKKWPDIEGHIWLDPFKGRIFTDLFGEEEEWCGAFNTMIAVMIQERVGMARVNDDMVDRCAVVVARANQVNSCRNWLDSLKWDRTERLEHVIGDAFKGPENEYSAAVGRCWFTSMVARVYRPGAKVDTLPVFEGRQGTLKSTALSVIGGPYYAECHTEVLSKDFCQILEGKMLVEICELHSFNRAEVERIKGVVSCAIDRYRRPYDRYAADYPRTAVLAGTTNRDDWQRDDTGARRFWPIRTGSIDTSQIAINREQYFAEAVQLFKSGRSWWDVPAELAAQEQESRRPEDMWAEPISEFILGKELVTTSEIGKCLDLPSAQSGGTAASRISAIMRVLGWEQKRDRKLGKQQRYWQRTVPLSRTVPD
jgi:putative DNA primase/helicase